MRFIRFMSRWGNEGMYRETFNLLGFVFGLVLAFVLCVVI